MPVRRGIFVAPFDELADPRRLAALAARAEARGWDGVFLWDHVSYDAPVRAVLDPWVALAAIAIATERVVLGPLVTPLARRRVQKLARETATLDLLSGGRLVLGAGLGGDRGGELSAWGEEQDPRARAALLDDGLARLDELWARRLRAAPGRLGRPPAHPGLARRPLAQPPARGAGRALGRRLPHRPRARRPSPSSSASCASCGAGRSTASTSSSRTGRAPTSRPGPRPGRPGA